MAERGEEGFLGRWSRLKREVQVEEPAAPPQEALLPEAVPPEPSPEPSPGETGEEVADLPALDSLDAGSDYTGFLRREVPADLRREALRRAWTSDPVIAGFRGFAEYDWDYNAPGYGALRPTDDIARLLNAVLPDEKREEDEAVVKDEAEVAGLSPETAESATALPPQPSPAMRERGVSAEPEEAPLPPKAVEG
ncbi:DUF3306 domain-containing protein [Azospirillum sp. TSH64]|uniref:DUF3306 domain-containing protein n=1 Tax=Azospirillum sp. TSH64 TaxID=652740 RepID=UPI000D695C75|nr:DUF3306 domain-containing protein [Azospirillum sp. TSH64]